jgi:hypothetical protein
MTKAPDPDWTDPREPLTELLRSVAGATAVEVT